MTLHPTLFIYQVTIKLDDRRHGKRIRKLVNAETAERALELVKKYSRFPIEDNQLMVGCIGKPFDYTKEGIY